MNIRPLSIELQSISALNIKGVGVANGCDASYYVAFSDKDAGTIVDQILTMHVTPDLTTATFNIGECKALTPEAAVEKLADWCEAFAATLRSQKPKINIPLY